MKSLKLDNYLEFFGATEQVTGSMFLLVVNGKRILIDCGLDFDSRNSSAHIFPFKPSSLDAVILTHAHVDHSGRLPFLVTQGFEGIIYASYGTFQLCQILLADAARIQKRQGKPYPNEEELTTTFDHFQTVDIHDVIDLSANVKFELLDAGHLLGACQVLVRWTDKEADKSILFSGDLGRKNYPLLVDPEEAPQVDYLVCESTYGNRYHEEWRNGLDVMEAIIKEACVERPGRLIIPAFSVGRTQTLLYVLNRLAHENRLPQIKIFTDSPLAHRSTALHDHMAIFLNEEAQAFKRNYQGLFNLDNLIYIPDMNSAEEIGNYHEPAIIITSSGMVAGGKSEDHVLQNIENSYCTFLFIGYCAPGTLGRRLLDSKETLKVHGEMLNVEATIVQTDVFSGHADRGALLEKLMHHSTSEIFLVHGEVESMESLQNELKSQAIQNVHIPRKGEAYDLK